MDFVCRLYICFLCLFGVVFGDYNWSSNPGDGTAGDPYQISTAEQLASIGSDATLLDKYFILTDDIDMSGYLFDNSPIAPDTDQDNDYAEEYRFAGSLNGQGHRILNLTITRSGTSYNIGLVGLTTGTSWEVKNLGLEEVDISVGDSSEYIGGLVARGYGGTVSDCYVTGLISSGTNTVKMGGLMGQGSTHISNCYTMCTITNSAGSSSTGGAIGRLTTVYGILEKSYSIGFIDSESTLPSVGALVGDLVSGPSVNDSYYLSSAGGNNTIGTPGTVAQLTQIANYTNWEFNGAQLGNQGHWRMRDDQSDYPYLAWEFRDADFYGDFKIDMLDYAALSRSWKAATYSIDYNWLCDLDGDGAINLVDLQGLCDDWLVVY